MKDISNCPICNNKNILFVFKQNDKNLNINGEFSAYNCQNCKCIFLNPRPSFKELSKYYSSDKYYSLSKVNLSAKTKLKIRLYEIYFNKEKNNLLLKLFFSPLKFIVRGTELIKNGKVLDVGCGSGQFLYEMRELGMQPYGVEPGEFDRASNEKYKLNIKNCELIYAKYQANFFDVITMNHVLEHVPNPKETLLEIKRILKKNGKFIIGVPNTNSLAYKLFRKNWHQLDVPRHLIDYSASNLTYLLKKTGFKIKKVRYNSRPNQFVVSLYYLFGITKRNKIITRILELIFSPLTWIVNSLKSGDQIEIWCEKS